MPNPPEKPGPLRLAVLVLFNVWVYFAVFAFTLPFAVAALLVAWVPPRGDLMIVLARLWSRLLLAAAGIRVATEGVENVPRDRPCVVMANHGSYWDIPVLFTALPVQVRFFAKKSLFVIPVFGWALSAAGFIPIDRKNRRTAVKAIETAAERLAAGRSILLFPEETRSPEDSMLPFQRGGFLLAMRAAVPIVPVGIAGARAVMAKSVWLVRPGRIRVRFGVPLETAGASVREKDGLMRIMRESIEALRGTGGADPAVIPPE